MSFRAFFLKHEFDHLPELQQMTTLRPGARQLCPKSQGSTTRYISVAISFANGNATATATSTTTIAAAAAVSTPRRSFHTSRALSKNPYHFYDVLARQPRSSFDPAQFSFNHGHLSPTDRVKLVFGQLGSRQDRRLEALKRAHTIAGIKLSPRPDEPNNCCMSGCVDCVWELYKDELTEWKAKRQEIKRKLMFERADLEWPVTLLGPEPKERNKSVRPEDRARIEDSVVEDDADDDLNVSIKAFLKTEKKLKAKRKRQLELQSAPETQNQQASA